MWGKLSNRGRIVVAIVAISCMTLGFVIYAGLVKKIAVGPDSLVRPTSADVKKAN